MNVLRSSSLSALLALPALLALGASAGCAKSPTTIDVQVTADETVPQVAILRSIVARQSAPEDRATLEFASGVMGSGDAATPSGFRFPFLLQVHVPPGWNGPVTVTVEGVDWMTGKVNARGTTEATVASAQTTMAALMLTGVSTGGGGDGGTDGGAGSDGGGSSDAATD